MKDKEELKEDAGLVRDIVAVCSLKFPTADESKMRDSLFRKTFTLVSKLEIHHIRRINEALCDLDYASETAAGLRQATLYRLARYHDLKSFRKVEMPKVSVPQKTQSN